MRADRQAATSVMKPAVALLLVGASYAVARPPALEPSQAASLHARFAFSRYVVPSAGYEPPARRVRNVNPSYDKIQSWISAVGAGVALADLDGDALPNDLCSVDPRTDRVTVAPAPGTGHRYVPFVLQGPSPDLTTAPMGCLPADLDEDGRLDLVVYYWGRTPSAYLRRGAAGDPLDASAYHVIELVAGGEAWYTNALAQADVDGDGHLDLVVGNYFAEDAAVLDPSSSARSGMQSSMSHARNGGRNRLLLWEAAGQDPEPYVRFRDASAALDDHGSRAWTLGVGAASLDGDLLPELYFANDFGPDLLLQNVSAPGQPRFVNLRGERTAAVPKSKTLGMDSFKGMGVDFGDVSGDGRLDIFVSNIAEEYALEESHFVWVQREGEWARGVAPFDDQSERLGLARSGWAWDVKLEDFDNDGRLEVVQGTGFVKGHVDRWPELHELAMANDAFVESVQSWFRLGAGDDISGHGRPFFFARAEDGRFHDIAQSIGLGAPQLTRGVATADVDGDGRVDLAMANQWGDSYFYRNESAHVGRFLGLRLLVALEEGCTPGPPPPGSPAIGARAEVHLPDGRRYVGVVDGGNGHSGKRSPDLRFGLGEIPVSSRLPVEVRWRTREGQERGDRVDLGPGWNTLILGNEICVVGESRDE